MEDLDLLVPIGARSAALAVLGRLGFRGAADPATVSHELALGRQGVIVDLHWHLARPGRIPSAFEAGMLARRRHTGPLSVPDPLDAAAVALAHPALTEHVSGRLLRILALHHLLAAMAGREAELAAHLRRYRLSTAAWAQVAWARRFVSDPRLEALEARLRPAPLRRRYLERWLDAEPEQLYWRFPALVRGGFSLALSEGPAQAARALLSLAAARRRAQAEAAEVEAILSRYQA